jgi:hypothetical protein
MIPISERCSPTPHMASKATRFELNAHNLGMPLLPREKISIGTIESAKYCPTPPRAKPTLTAIAFA